MQVLNEEDVKGWIPSGEQKSVVTMLAAFGHTPEEIALVIYPNGPISVSTLRRKFNDELKNSKVYSRKWLLEEMMKNVYSTNNGLVLTNFYKEMFGKEDKTKIDDKKEEFMSAGKVKFCVDCKHLSQDGCFHPNLGISFVTKKSNHVLCVSCRRAENYCSKDAKWFEPKEKKTNDDYYDKVKSEINSMADTLPKKPEEINEMVFTEEKLIDLAMFATKEQKEWEETVKETCEAYQELAMAANNLRYALFGGDEEL
jgi:glycine cleavage system H lipoate-binding protein